MKVPVTVEAVRIYFSVNPWIRLLLPFGSGIAIALLFAPGKDFYYQEMYGLLFFLLLAYFLTLYDKNGLGLKKWIPGMIGLVFLFCAGFQLARAGMSLRSPRHFSKHSWRLLCIQVNSIPEDRGKRIRFQARVLFGNPGAGSISPGPDGSSQASDPVDRPAITARWTKTKGRLLVYLRPDTLRRVAYGDRLLIAPAFREVAPPENPAEFDYRSYLAGKDIYHQAYLSAKQWCFTGQRGGNPLIGRAARLQQRCVHLFRQAFERESDAAMLSAFILGYRSGIDPATEAAFADTGTIHILSVSGLHVAILYWLVCLLLSPLDKLPAGKLFQLLLATGSIAVYAFVTGLSPPVCRSAWMIGFCQFARFLGREHQTGNALALTAFLLLANNPLVLADVGFQLSFLAAAGLTGCAPLLSRHSNDTRPGERRQEHRRRRGRSGSVRLAARLGRVLCRQLGSMTVVSLAAQLVTFPLAMYYFHRFPVYFLPANLLLIPLASLILYGGILLLPISAIAPLSTLLAAALSRLIDVMKLLMDFFSGLPGAVLGGIWIHPVECAGIYLLIACVLAFLFSGKGGWLCAAMASLVFLMAASTIENYRQAGQRQVIFFHVRENTVIGFLTGKKAVLFHEKPPGTADSAKQDPYFYSVHPFLQRSGITQVTHRNLREDFRGQFLVKKGAWLQFFDLRILLAGSDFSYPPSQSNPGRCDLLLVTENSYLQTEKLRRAFRINMLVTGADISASLTRFLKKNCRVHGTDFYSVKESGAFLLRLNKAGHRDRKRTN